MKKRILSILLAIVMVVGLMPGFTLAASTADSDDIEREFTINWFGPCDVVNTPSFDLYSYLPNDAQVSGGISFALSDLLSGCTPNWSTSTASINLTTKIFDEPCSDKFTVTLNTDNYGEFTFHFNISLTGKYIVKFTAQPQDAFYDGNPHAGFTGLKGMLTNGAEYTGEYDVAYATADGATLPGAPSDIGSYQVTISVPADDEDYKGSLTLNFEIFDKPEAIYQAEENGEWKQASFAEAVANVYNGGTVKLLKDIKLSTTVVLAKNMTITSNSGMYIITTAVNEHGYLLNSQADVTLTNVTVDGGSGSDLTAKRALIAVNGGKLTIGSGATICNNNNITTNGAGGAVCVISGECVLNGGAITGNKAYSGGGIAVAGGTLIINSGEISANTATGGMFSAGGGALYAFNNGIIAMNDGIVENNSAGSGGAIWLTATASFKIQGGSITGNTASYGAALCTLQAGFIEFSGGTITNNTATYDAGAAYIVAANVTFSGNAIISGNTCGAYAPDVYLINNPTVTVGNMGSNANIDLYTNRQPAEGETQLVANPASSYTMTEVDVGKFSYSDSAYRLKLNSSGQMVLVKVTLYDVSVESGTGGGKYAEGDTVTITANAPENGKKFTGWTSEDNITVADASATETTFTMPAKNVTVTATFKPIQPITFDTSERNATYGDGTLDARTATAAGAITYSSNDESIATVDENGVVTVLSAGEVIITATAAETADYASDSVSYKLIIAPKTLTITAEDKEAYVGSRQPELTYTVEGLVGSDALTTVPTLTTDANMNRAGTYEIVISGAVTSDNYTITHVNGTLTVENYPYIPVIPTTYSITVKDSIGGDVDANRSYAAAGTTVKLTVTPDDGYELDTLTVKAGSREISTTYQNGTYNFTMPYANVTVTATFKKVDAPVVSDECSRDWTCPMYGYTDLNASLWYHDGIHFCIGNDLMQGIGNNQFDPDGTTTRAMIVTILWRLEGSPVVNYAMNFEDVAADTWYTEAIRWAADNKIVEGYGNGKFGTSDAITREQMVTIMYRYAQYKGYDVSVGENTNILSYNDAFDVAEWAIPAMQWACGSGMIQGIADGSTMNLAPQGNATRAQSAAILQRFCENVAEN